MKYAYTFLLSLCVSVGVTAQDLVSIELRGELSRELFNFGAASAGFEGFTAEYGFEYYVVEYTSLNLAGELDTLSGLLSVPTPNTATVFPRLLSQHGTSQTSDDAPSATFINFADLPGSYIDLSVVYATQGYVTVAPDYLNMGLDDEGFHPYVHAASEARAAADMLLALEADSTYAALTNDQLFVTGYSQGGHASMALHERIATDVDYAALGEVTAAAHMSGPYALEEVMLDELILNDSTYLFVGFVPFTVLSFQAAYPELEQDLDAIFRPAVVPAVERFRDEWQAGTYTLGEMTEDVAVAIARLDPDNGDTLVYPYEMFTAEFEAELRDDADSPWRAALRQNNTYRFTSAAPTRLYYCTGDELVPSANTLLAADSLAARGAVDLEAVRVDSDEEPLGHGACAEPAILASLEFFGALQDIQTDGNTGLSDALPGRIDWRLAGASLSVETERPDEAYTLRLFDALGRELLRRPAYRSGELVDLSGLPTGFAVARLGDARGRSASRSFVVR